MGSVSSGDFFNRALDNVLISSTLVKLMRDVDDILLYADTVEELLQNLIKLIELCLIHNKTLSSIKLQWAVEHMAVIYAGMQLSIRTCSQDPKN